jgi:membrane protein implicated in regulation of membrane protease activity
MLSAYIVCLLAGGIVLVASILGGHESDAGGGAHVGDAGGGGDASHDLHAHHEWMGRLPFLSLRFWIWAATFFGLTGLVLSLTGASAMTALATAIAAGAGTGWGASYVVSKLTKDEVGVLPEASSHIGCEGRLLLPLAHGERGKVRLRVGGTDVDLVAESDGQESLPAGTSVLVVGLRGTHVVVEASPVPPERESTSDTDKERS